MKNFDNYNITDDIVSQTMNDIQSQVVRSEVDDIMNSATNHINKY